KLGIWAHPSNMPDEEDIHIDPQSTPFTKEIDDALSPYQAILIQLLDTPDDVPAAAVHALSLLFLGDLSIKDCAGINNWFASIPAVKERNIDWLESLAICHARILLIMARKRPEFFCEPDCPVIEAGEEEKLYRFLPIDKAWWEQERLHSPGTLRIVDVIWESVQDLEERMFEYSDAAGWVRNCQWGLDAGTYQNNWDPYITIHPQGGYKAYVGGESDMEASTKNVTSSYSLTLLYSLEKTFPMNCLTRN
ncbi:hypothetical protein C8J56DRAFT_787299, partial [Mycena floridula]